MNDKSSGDGVGGESAILSTLFAQYLMISDQQRQRMASGPAGTSQLAALLDNYVKSQTLALMAQLNLQNPEDENSKIKATLKSLLTVLVEEWQRFAGSNQVPGVDPKTLSAVSQGWRDVLMAMDVAGVLPFERGLLGVTVAVRARLAIAVK